MQEKFPVGTAIKGFVVTKSMEIPELQCYFTELKHEESGAEVLHIEADDPENFFCLSFSLDHVASPLPKTKTELFDPKPKEFEMAWFTFVFNPLF